MESKPDAEKNVIAEVQAIVDNIIAEDIHPIVGYVKAHKLGTIDDRGKLIDLMLDSGLVKIRQSK